MTSRRNLIGLFAGLGFLDAVPASATGAPMSKDQVGYQDVPSGGQVCAQCVYFIFKPSQGNVVQSRCKLVAGPISPSGWCEVWQPKA